MKLRSILLVMVVNVVIFYLLLFSLNAFFVFTAVDKAQTRNHQKKNYDMRSRFEVVRDYRNKGVEAYPSVYPAFMDVDKGLASRLNDFLPLGGISNVTTVFCNEIGTWSVYQADRYGFNNDDAAYDKGRIDALLLGDSFAQGACVSQEETIAGVLRRSGINALSLGMRADGPDMELATLLEYAPILKPKRIVWIFYANDVSDLRRFSGHPVLSKYLSGDFTQDLVHKQEKIDSLWKEEANRLFNNEQIGVDQRGSVATRESLTVSARDFFGLTYLQARLGVAVKGLSDKRVRRDRTYSYAEYPGQLKEFQEIIRLAKREADKLGAEFYFVYVPDYYSLMQGTVSSPAILKIVGEEGITKVVDFERFLLDCDDPRQYYPFGLFGHLNKDGYGALAREIKRVF